MRFFPLYSIERISTDHLLKKLGFVDGPPCVFSIDITWAEYENMMYDLMQLETDAFNTKDGKMPAEDDPYYTKYIKYGWLWDMFSKAHEQEKIKEAKDLNYG